MAGVDEVGKGAWAGPLTIGAVVLPREGSVEGIRDSKMLTPSKRQQLSAQIRSWAQDWAVGHASARECDELGMSEAQRVATRRALDRLKSCLIEFFWMESGITSIGCPARQLLKATRSHCR